ncbi:Serine/threonine-protein kinase PknD [compost metagenome]
MFRMKTSLPTLLAVALLAGCSPATLSLDPMSSDATLEVSPRIQAGGYAAQALVSPYTGADVNHLMLTLYTVAGSTETQVATSDVPQADLGKSIVFGKLRPDLKYRIKAKAYKATGTAAADLISLDASSSVDVVVGREDRHAIALTVRLIDRLFSASSTLPGVTVTNGQYAASGSTSVTSSAIPSRSVLTLAGDGSFGHQDGTGTAAKLSGPTAIAKDGQDNLYVADTSNDRIRKITPAGVVTTFAGSSQGYADGSDTSAKFHWPQGIAVDSAGNVFVADTFNHRIRRIDATTRAVTTFAGSGLQFNMDGTGTAAAFRFPRGLAFDAANNLYVADYGNHAVRKITPGGVVSTFAGSAGMVYGTDDGTGTSARFNSVAGLAFDGAGNLYAADFGNSAIRKIVLSTAAVTTLAGDGNPGYQDGVGTAAKFHYPYGVAHDGAGNLYVSDTSNHRIRKVVIATGAVSTFAGDGNAGYQEGVGTAAKFSSPRAIAISAAGMLYVADENNSRIRWIFP